MKLNNFCYIFIAASLFLASGCGNAAPESATQPALASSSAAIASDQALPRVASHTVGMPHMLEFGSKQCKACKAMEPVLETLTKDHGDKLTVEFVDVWVPENQTFARSYSIESIPTQVFLNREGKEVFRHTGFFSDAEILASLAELGLIGSATADPTEPLNASEATRTE